MKVEILGSGCSKCKTLEELVREIVDELGLDVEVTKVSDIDRIIAYGVMFTPALVIDGHVKIAGRLPSRNEVEEQLRNASE